MNKRNITLIGFILITGLSTLLSGQSEVMDSTFQLNLVKVTMKKAGEARSTEPLDQLLAAGTITLPLYRSHLLSGKAYIKGINLIRNLDNYSPSEKMVQIQNVINLYNSSMYECGECLYKRLNDKISFLEQVNFEEEEYKRTLYSLDSLGYKPDKASSLALGLTFMTGQKSQWLGLRGSFGHFRYMYKKSSFVRKSINLLTFQYSKNINQRGHEWTFGVLDFDGPYLIQLCKFGNGTYYQNATSYHSWFYRPELGFNVFGFQLSYAHSFYFKKSPDYVDKNHLILRYTF